MTIQSLILSGLIVSASGLTACADNDPAPMAAQTSTTLNSTPTSEGALGLTLVQLSDADILDPNGKEIGEVERLITDESGKVTSLLIEIEDTNPDRYVEITLDNLTAKQVRDDWDLQSTMTREDLMAMPEAK